MELEIKRIGEDILEDFLQFFDNVAFMDNPDWSVCYCYCYLYPGKMEEFGKRSAETNRNDAINSIREGKMKGYLACMDNQPVGWCNVNSKQSYPMLYTAGMPVAAEDSDIHSIVCFIVDPGKRRQGIARKILQMVCSECRKSGVKILEAYPNKSAASDAHHYPGPLQLYLDTGFEEYAKKGNLVIVRKYL